MPKEKRNGKEEKGFSFKENDETPRKQNKKTKQ